MIEGTYRVSSPESTETVYNFDALFSYQALLLSQKLGDSVVLQLSKAEKQDVSLRARALLSELQSSSTLSGALRFVEQGQTMSYSADFKAGRLTLAVAVDASSTGRQLTKVKNLVRALEGARPDLRIEAVVKGSRGADAIRSLSVLREAPDELIEDSEKELKGFIITLSQSVGYKSSVGRGSFITALQELTEEFYTTVLTAVTPKEPARREEYSFPTVDMAPFEGLDYGYSKTSTDAPKEDARFRVFDSHSNQTFSRSAKGAYVTYVASLCELEPYRTALMEHRGLRRTFLADPNTIADDTHFHLVDDQFAFYNVLSRQSIASNLEELGELLGMSVAIEEL